jgi:hypothetical protein
MSHETLLDLSRWQWALTAAFHITFPTVTVGTSACLIVGLRHPRQHVIGRRGLPAAAPGPVRVHLAVAALGRDGHGAS